MIPIMTDRIVLVLETSNEIYDGTFTHTKKKGDGVTAELLKKKGIKVYTENEIDELLK